MCERCRPTYRPALGTCASKSRYVGREHATLRTGTSDVLQLEMMLDARYMGT